MKCEKRTNLQTGCLRLKCVQVINSITGKFGLVGLVCIVLANVGVPNSYYIFSAKLGFLLFVLLLFF